MQNSAWNLMGSHVAAESWQVKRSRLRAKGSPVRGCISRGVSHVIERSWQHDTDIPKAKRAEDGSG